NRPEKAEPYRQQILELFSNCKGNLMRVHEELVASGAQLSYPALTAFCRRHGIGYAPPTPVGQYHDALHYFGGATKQVMIDNTHVVVLRGTGREMVPVPEMDAFAERFGFQFVAHEIGDANRSARVERPFSFIDGNFLAGRTFSSWEDLNLRARQWCDKVNSTYKKHLRAVPRELFAVERLHLTPLPGVGSRCLPVS
ncbi:MAG: IS21 family transposase, partial [Acidobacteriia bacterium]|nr:IS21 family transposase [Terriglobia bacterium]